MVVILQKRFKIVFHWFKRFEYPRHRQLKKLFCREQRIRHSSSEIERYVASQEGRLKICIRNTELDSYTINRKKYGNKLKVYTVGSHHCSA